MGRRYLLTDDDLGVLLDALVEGRNNGPVFVTVTILVEKAAMWASSVHRHRAAFGARRAPVEDSSTAAGEICSPVCTLAVAVTSQFAEPATRIPSR